MIGLVVLLAGAIYLAILVWATRAAYRWASAKGWPKARCRLAAAAAFLAVYLPVFWDHIPTLLTYEYSCLTQAGYWEYKTLDEWTRENPGVAGTLTHYGVTYSKHEGTESNYTDTYYLNERFNSVRTKSGPHLFNRWRWERKIVDSKTGETLARSVDFSAGNGFIGGSSWPLKFWLQLKYCGPEGGSLYSAEVSGYVRAVRALETGDRR